MCKVSELLERNGWQLEHMGGSCTAYTKTDGSYYWLMTRRNYPTAPVSMSDPVTIGKYRRDNSDPAAEPTDWSSLQSWAESHYLIAD